MLKTLLTAAALTLTAGLGHASPLRDSIPLVAQVVGSAAQQTGYYCEWATIYDVWGNWVTAYQCF